MHPAPALPVRPRVRPTRGERTGIPSLIELREHLAAWLTVVRRPARWSTRGRAFAVVAALYVALTVLVLVPGTPVLHLDGYLADLRLAHRYPQWHEAVSVMAGFGQRWIVTTVLQVLFIWACLRARSLRPMVQFVVALILLNSSVGIVKTILGRIGPAHQNNVHDFFVVGGNIFPSGHVSNAVAMYGVLVVALPRFRRSLTALAVVLSVMVGGATVFLRTHWFSDVVGGWLAGLLVLLLLPTISPWMERFVDYVIDALRVSAQRRPHLLRTGRAVLGFLMWLVPADARLVPDAAARRPARRARLHPRHRVPDVEQFPAGGEVDRRAAHEVQSADEFAGWPDRDEVDRAGSPAGR